jgi:hypothetical protein
MVPLFEHHGGRLGMLDVGGCLLVRLAGSGILRAHEPLLEASIEMAGKLAPGQQSGHVDAGTVVRHRAARIGSPSSGLPHVRLGGQDAAFPRQIAGRVAVAGWGAMDA